MSMRALKILAIFLTCCLLSLASAGGTARAEQTDGTDYRDIFIKANHKMLKMKNYHMAVAGTASVTLQGKDMNIAVDGDFDVQLRPMLMQAVMNVAMDAAGKRSEFTMTQFAEEAGDKLAIYAQIGGKWLRQIVPKPREANYDDILKNFDRGVKAISSVTLTRETDEALVLEVTVNIGKLLESVSEELVSPDGKKIVLPKALLEDLEDLVYTAEVDKKTMLISGLSIDLSALIGSIGGKILAAMQLPADKQAIAMEIVDSLKIQGNIAISRYDAAGPIIIPAAARNAPLSTPKTPDKPDTSPTAKQPAPGAGTTR